MSAHGGKAEVVGAMAPEVDDLRVHGREPGRGQGHPRPLSRRPAGRARSCRCCIWRRSSTAAGCRSRRSTTSPTILGMPRDPGLRGRQLLRHVQHRAGRAGSRSGSARRRPAGCAARTTCVRACKDTLGIGIGESTAGRALLPARVRVPGRLRQRAGALDRRRLLRGHRLRRDQGGARGAEARRAADARAAERAQGRRCRSAARRRSWTRVTERSCCTIATASSPISTASTPWGLEAARRRGDWDGTKDFDPQGPRLAGRSRSRTAACAGAAGPASATGLKWSFMPKQPTGPALPRGQRRRDPSPAPARTGRSCATTRTSWSRAA